MRTKRVILIGYPDADGLDLFGPAEVFREAVQRVGAQVYEVILASGGGGRTRLSSGAVLETRKLASLRPRPSDTALVAGGLDAALEVAAADARIIGWLQAAARVVARIGSVCDGAFVAARAGLLNGHRAATHWASCDRLAQAYPHIRVDREAIFVRDGKVWTAAGVSTGIDMALAMVEEDCGRRVADAVAARLVLFARRPGFQSQFSEELVAQGSASDPLGPTISWLRQNLRQPLDVTALAGRAGMSVRSLHRACAKSLDLTPAKLIEKLRVEQARTLLATTQLGTKSVALRCGFGTAPRMSRAFERALGVPPGAYRWMFARPQSAELKQRRAR